METVQCSDAQTSISATGAASEAECAQIVPSADRQIFDGAPTMPPSCDSGADLVYSMPEPFTLYATQSNWRGGGAFDPQQIGYLQTEKGILKSVLTGVKEVLITQTSGNFFFYVQGAPSVCSNSQIDGPAVESVP